MLLKITLNSGMVGTQETQRRVVRALGLGKYGSSVCHIDSPTIRGMINKVAHLVTVSEEKEQGAQESKAAAKPKKTAVKAG